MKKITTALLLASAMIFTGLLSANPQSASAANCTPHATKQCISNIVYWYDSCGALQGIAQNCSTTNQICQNATCVNKTTTTTPPATTANHAVKSCYNGDLYWFSSTGAVSDLYKSCSDNNSCTLDNCGGNQCANELKCDGSTCNANSADYAKYCGNGTGTQTTTGTTTTTTVATANQSITITLFTTNTSSPLQFAKNITAANGTTLHFLAVIKNASDTATDNTSVKVDLGSTTTFTGNLSIDNLASAGNVVSGIELGSMPARSSKTLSFDASLVAQNNPGPFPITATINSNSTTYDSDSVTITPASTTTVTTATNPTASNSFFGSLIENTKQNWILWLVIIIVLIVVFVIIFRRLSTQA